MSIFRVEAPSGELFEMNIAGSTQINRIAADFFAAQDWPERGPDGLRQRAVVDFVNPLNPDESRRLNGDDTLEEAGIRDGATLSIFPESVAGARDQRNRLNALVLDLNKMSKRFEQTPNPLSDADARRAKEGVFFSTNREYAPDKYTFAFIHGSFVERLPNDPVPRTARVHRAEIVLHADYPDEAPWVKWLTPIFHPNIDPEGNVCLGVLSKRWLPGKGLAKLVSMLVDMLLWRNYDELDPFNNEAAIWALQESNWPHIKEIGGHRYRRPMDELLKEISGQGTPIAFRRIVRRQHGS